MLRVLLLLLLLRQVFTSSDLFVCGCCHSVSDSSWWAFLEAPRQLGHLPPTNYQLPHANCQLPIFFLTWIFFSRIFFQQNCVPPKKNLLKFFFVNKNFISATKHISGRRLKRWLDEGLLPWEFLCLDWLILCLHKHKNTTNKEMSHERYIRPTILCTFAHVYVPLLQPSAGAIKSRPKDGNFSSGNFNGNQLFLNKKCKRCSLYIHI